MSSPWIDAKVTPIPTDEWILIYVPDRPWGSSQPGEKHKVKSVVKTRFGTITEFGPGHYDEKEIALWMHIPDPVLP